MPERSLIVNPIFHGGLNSHCISVLNEGFFSVAEIWDTEDSKVWNQLNRLAPAITVDVSISPLMVEKGMSIVDTDESVRLFSLDYVYKRIEFLFELGIKNIAISSPPNVEKLRDKNIALLTDSICRICEFAKGKDIGVSFEPFDCDIHKRRLIGTTNEFLCLARNVRKVYDNFYLIWDSAHVYLQERMLMESLVESQQYIKRIHFANACINTASPYYGDHHIPFDINGNIHESELKKLHQLVIKASNIESIAFEIAVHRNVALVSSPQDVLCYIRYLHKYIEDNTQ